MKLDRTKAPEFKVVEHIDIIKATMQTLDNGIPLYSIVAGTQDLARVDIIFEAGEWYQHMPLLSNATISMLCEGSLFHTSEEIAEKLDFYGSYVYYNSYRHLASITIYSLHKYLEETIQLIEEIIKSPRFPAREFETFNNKRRQQFVIDDQKVEIKAQKQFSRVVFGQKHPYGNIPLESDFNTLNVDLLREFHIRHFSSSSCKILVAGKVNSNQIALINRHFGSDAWGTPNGVVACHHQLEPAADKKIFIPKPDAVQCAIRIGKATINKLHPDYQYLNVVNMILGGYFGSRLMSNIREEKGYTYGIGSGLVSYQKAGSFVIVSEVGKNVLPQALVEVYKEINKLRDDLVPNQELTLVKNYMMGGILRNFDGPFALLDSFRGLLEYNLEYDYLDNMINVVKSITPEQVRDIAQKYLDVNSLYEVVVG